MNLLKATNEQLYQIAIEEPCDMSLKYAVAYELQRRSRKCKYPECNNNAAKTWALVDLCGEHHDIIKVETDRYYSGKTLSVKRYEQRPHYYEIARLIPWSRP
jgi:hypothetical protein